MEVDGAVLCHVMNLYSMSLDPNPYARRSPEPVPDYADEKLCKFLFGTLAWEKTNGQIHAHFDPGLEIELNGEKTPFGAVGLMLEKAEPNTWMATYFTALMHGVSDPDLQLPEATASIKERIEKYLYCFRELTLDRSKPRVITPSWFEEAARVRRRILTQGGEDQSFFTDICEVIDKHWRLADEPNRSRSSAREVMKRRVRELFLFEEETFTFWVAAPSRKLSFSLAPHDLARAVLNGYEHEPPGSWKHELYTMKEDVIKVFKTSNRVTMNSNIWLIQFTSGCPLWNERILLGAPAVL
jgi:hypothetical protein